MKTKTGNTEPLHIHQPTTSLIIGCKACFPALKKWQVGVCITRIEYYTVEAKNEDEAKEIVLSGDVVADSHDDTIDTVEILKKWEGK